MILDFSRPLLMGIINLTPDSFSDGGHYTTLAGAVERGLRMVEHGADIIDVGGESTRPGSCRVSADVQCQRILEVIAALRDQLPPEILISVDTTLSGVAAAAIESGARMVNDVSAGRDDPAMLELVAKSGVYWVMMHMWGSLACMREDPDVDDPLGKIESFFAERRAVAVAAGVDRERLIFDPGIGFGKTRRHNLLLMGALSRLRSMGQPILLGVSRKQFMGSLCRVSAPSELLPATCAATALGVMAGVDMFRVHDVAENRQAADVAWAIRNATR
ncbi:MAG: dihydropteroate synthase [Gammaproteobacteria bacterium]|nr:dihydropteroate synthase [Gammaproteobacteria bacterium]